MGMEFFQVYERNRMFIEVLEDRQLFTAALAMDTSAASRQMENTAGFFSKLLQSGTNGPVSLASTSGSGIVVTTSAMDRGSAK